MAMDFPTSPALNQTYTYAGITYTWNGYGWIGGALGSAAVISDAPQDGGEYTRVNGLWRLKEQNFNVGNSAYQDIFVPANVKMCQLNGAALAPAASANQVGLRVSYDGTTFAAGASDYNMGGGGHDAGTNGFVNIPGAAVSFIPLTATSDNAAYVHNFTAEIVLARADTSSYFGCKVYGSNFNSSAVALHRHQWLNGFPAAAGSNLAIKALRLFMAYGGNFGVSAYINVRWMY